MSTTDMICNHVLGFLEKSGGEWRGTATELSMHVTFGTFGASSMSRMLNMLEKHLADRGILIERYRGPKPQYSKMIRLYRAKHDLKVLTCKHCGAKVADLC